MDRHTARSEYKPAYGRANPERMERPFWEWMVRHGGNAYAAREQFDIPWGSEPDRSPLWCFERFGASRTRLPDGRVVCVGGEHEDFYDPDFCVYNDLVLLGPGDEVTIYGYPITIFPPTHGHTATLWGDEILLVGSHGCMTEKRPRYTPVYSVNLGSFTIREEVTRGGGPGWVWDHAARLDGHSGLIVRGGSGRDDREQHRLDLATWTWSRLPLAPPLEAWYYLGAPLTVDDQLLVAEAWQAELSEALEGCLCLTYRARLREGRFELALRGDMTTRQRAEAAFAAEEQLRRWFGRLVMLVPTAGPSEPTEADGWRDY